MSPKHNWRRGQLCMEPNSFMAGSGVSFPFLCVFVFFFFFSTFYFLQVLHYSSFLVLQKLYQVDLFLTMRLISPQRPLLLSVIVVWGRKKREERRKKMQREEEYCAVFLEEKSSGCFTQHLEASAVMVKEGFAIKGVRNQKDILVDTLFKRPNFHILSGNMFHNVFSMYKYHKLGGENKNIFIFALKRKSNLLNIMLAATGIILTSR